MIRLLNLGDHNAEREVGQKAASLQWLSKHGRTIPRTFVLPYESYRAFLADRLQFQQGLTHQVEYGPANLPVEMDDSLSGRVGVDGKRGIRILYFLS